MAFALDCELWQGRVNEGGYGRIGSDLAHRRAYEVEYGPIGGNTIHHICGEKLCITPDHMISMPREMHVSLHKRGVHTAEVCGRCGQPFTHVDKRGWQQCRPCNTDRMRGYRRR